MRHQSISRKSNVNHQPIFTTAGRKTNPHGIPEHTEQTQNQNNEKPVANV